MRVLGIDASGEIGSVALVEDANLLCEISFAATLKHGEMLFAAIDRVLGLAGVDRSELEQIGVAIGPGSFTGLRIGVSSAKGLAQALEIPIVGIPSADTYWRKLGGQGSAWVLIPDRMRWVYATQYAVGGVSLSTTVLELDEFADKLEKHQSRSAQVLIGPAAELHRKRFEDSGFVVAVEPLNKPSAFEIAMLAQESVHAASQVNGMNIEPLYLQEAVSKRSVNE